ncbi:MAG TPA: CHAT domain-containing protein [Caldilineaceae bacterium]|nr:CHAT domain-containing protein [Caldilineaceae bacterium]
MAEELKITIHAAEPPLDGTNVNAESAEESAVGRFHLSTVAASVAALHELMREAEPSQSALEQHGAALFDALFTGDIATLLDRSLTLAAARQTPLRLRIVTGLPALLGVPWEYMYDGKSWPALHPQTTLVRTMPLRKREPQPVDGLLKVLVMLSAPTDLPELTGEQEFQQLARATLTAAVQLIPVAPTYDALQAAMRQHQPHIFHFVGHGFFSVEGDAGVADQGTLAFCRADNGKADYIAADRLLPLLTGGNLGLVLLNACKGAVTGDDSPFAGLTQRLLREGIPAVIAMQAPILNDDAIHFAAEFYAALADGYGIEQAVREGRKAIHGEAYTWGIPTFYLQANQPFDIPQLTDAQKAARLWQKSVTVQDPSTRRHLLECALALDDSHADALAGMDQLENAEEAARLYDAAKAYITGNQWREALRNLERVEQLNPGHADTRSLLAEVKGQIDGTPIFGAQEIAQYDQYAPIVNALRDGRLIPFLGWDVSRFGRPAQDGWAPGLYPPVPPEAAAALAEHLGESELALASLLEVSQYTTLLEGETALYERLTQLYNDYPPTYFHRLLAELTGRLRGKGYPADPTRRLIIFSTAFDDLLERAFAEAGQPYHLFAYRHQINDSGMIQPACFVHVPPTGEAIEVFSPNNYVGHMGADNRDDTPVIIKLCGRCVTPEPASVLVTEDHYLEYLPAQEIGALLPMTLLNQIRRRSFLFFGYSLQPWYFRLLWQRMRYQNRRLHDRSWAIVPALTRIEEEFWRSQEIVPIQAYPEAVVAYVNRWLEQLEARV